jgi:phage tail tube protein FII
MGASIPPLRNSSVFKVSFGSGQLTPLTIRGAVISDDGTQTAVVVNIQGIVREMDPGNWKPGEKATLKITLRWVHPSPHCETPRFLK